MKTVVIVQARMTSSRLPGKILLPVLGKPLLEHQIERLRRFRLADEIVIATTINADDQPIIDLCDRLGVAYFRGSEQDVLSRYYGAAVEHNADTVVRITSDCPVIDHELSDEVIQYYLDRHKDIEYVRTRNYPRGLDTEVFSFGALQRCYKEAVAQPDREHVTPYIYRNPQLFNFHYFDSYEDLSSYRWTVDTPEDYQLLKNIIEALYSRKVDFNYKDILALLAEFPEWVSINAHVRQKQYGE